MGWKRVKEYYRVEHVVQVCKDKGICIGSSYIDDLIVIGFDGVLKKRDDGRCNDQLKRYMKEFDDDPNKLKELVTAADTFEKAVEVYTYDGAKIVQKKCEQPGWPNVTHDGEIMYENTFSTVRADVVRWAKENAASGVRLSTELVDRKRKELAEAEAMLAECVADVMQLDAM